MRKTKVWTKEEEQVLIERYAIDGPQPLVKILDRTYWSVQRKANAMGLRAGKMTSTRDQQLKRLHIQTREKAALTPERIEQQRESSRKSNKARRERFRAAGLCIRCGAESLPGSKQYCLLHWTTIIGNASGRYDIAFGQMLLNKLESQGYRCAVTGDLLIPGKNASVDHIVPKSRGGALDDPDNLQWVTDSVNFAKRTFLPEEFVDFCRRVVAYHDTNS